MVYGVSENEEGVVIRMSGRLRPNEHLWLRRALEHVITRAASVLCDLTAVTRVGEPELFLLAMIRREVELRGGRVALRLSGEDHHPIVRRIERPW